MQSALLAALLTAATLAAQPQGVIEGQVVNTASGAPVRKAALHLSKDGGPSIDQDSDAEGRFRFTGLPPGGYRLSADHSGYFSQAYGARRYNSQGTLIQLSQDQQVSDIALRLTPQGVIVGRVLDEDGDPLPDVSIQLFKMVYRNGKRSWGTTGGAMASDIGEFRLAKLEPGKYLVGVMPPPRVKSATSEGARRKSETIAVPTYYPSALTEQSAVPIVVAAGAEIRGIEIHAVRVPTVHVSGAVSGIPEDAPRLDGSVVLLSEDGFASSPGATVRAGRNEFEIHGVPAGQYTLRAVYNYGSSSWMVGYLPVSVGSESVSGLTVTLQGGFDLPGTVASVEAPGCAKTVSVGLSSAAPHQLNMNNGFAEAAPDGRLVIKGVLPGRYHVEADPPPGCFVQKVTYGGQEVPRDGIGIAGPAPLEVILSSTAATITGLVTDKDGKPVANASVALIPSDANAPTKSTSTNDAGSFTVDRLRPGAYQLLAWDAVEPGAWEDPEFRKPFEALAIEVKVGPGERQTAQLHVIEP